MYKFLNETEARHCWEEMRLFHGADIDDDEAYHAWVEDNKVEWLDRDIQDFLSEGWKGVF